mmetsp:Transcript_91510/g.232826  ORF Transcript_91510/g.232826 Transcript_91510/m.232826 type:complete len:205 (-) Transcript_91510:1473-2087(-)
MFLIKFWTCNFSVAFKMTASFFFVFLALSSLPLSAFLSSFVSLSSFLSFLSFDGSCSAIFFRPPPADMGSAASSSSSSTSSFSSCSSSSSSFLAFLSFLSIFSLLSSLGPLADFLSAFASSSSFRRHDLGLNSCVTSAPPSQLSILLAMRVDTRFAGGLPGTSETSCSSRKPLRSAYATAPPEAFPMSRSESLAHSTSGSESSP